MSAFREEAVKLHRDQIGKIHLVLVEGVRLVFTGNIVNLFECHHSTPDVLFERRE